METVLVEGVNDGVESPAVSFILKRIYEEVDVSLIVIPIPLLKADAFVEPAYNEVPLNP